MNYGLVIDLNSKIDVDKVKEMNESERTKYFSKIEKQIKKDNSKHEFKMKNISKFMLDQLKKFEDLKDDFDVDEFKCLIYEKSSDDINVSRDTILFFSLFENIVRTGYDLVYSAKCYLDLITDLLYFYYENFNFKMDYENKNDNQLISIDVKNDLLEKYFDSLIEKYVDELKSYIYLGSYAIDITSYIIDKYVLDFTGLRDDFFMNIEMLTFTHKELDDISVVMNLFESDGFSVVKLTHSIFNLKDNLNDSCLKDGISYDLKNHKLLCDGFDDKIEINPIE